MPSSASDERFYRKIKAVACEAWGVTPWAFDASADAGEIACSDVMDLIEYKAHVPFLGEGVLQFIFGARIAERKAAQQRLVTLGQQLRVARTQEQRERIMAAIKEIEAKW